MNQVLLDTHVLIWIVEGDPALGANAIKIADSALKDGALLVSTITSWEIATLLRLKRLEEGRSVADWRQTMLKHGVIEIPVSGEIAAMAGALDGMHGDPADRIIAATAITQGVPLITADKGLLRWNGKALVRFDARK